MNKKQLSERDMCTKFITPSLRQAGWDEITQLREEVSFTSESHILSACSACSALIVCGRGT
jgi:type I site-specific restriction endonuclease